MKNNIIIVRSSLERMYNFPNYDVKLPEVETVDSTYIEFGSMKECGHSLCLRRKSNNREVPNASKYARRVQS